MISIIPHESNLDVDEAHLCFYDQEDDERVDKMVNLIKDATRFLKPNVQRRSFEGRHSEHA